MDSLAKNISPNADFFFPSLDSADREQTTSSLGFASSSQADMRLAGKLVVATGI